VPQELQLFLEAWGIVTTIALPLALAAWLAGGRGRLCPRWRLMPFRGTLLDFVFLYFVYHTAAGLGASAAMDAGVVGARASLVGSVVALPVVLAAAAVLWRLVHEQPVRFRRPRPRDVALGVVAGVVLTPLTHAVYAATVFVNARLGLPESPHPLAELGVGESPAAIALFFGSVCLVVPWLEEFLFRGIVLRWAARSRVGAALDRATQLSQSRSSPAWRCSRPGSKSSAPTARGRRRTPFAQLSLLRRCSRPRTRPSGRRRCRSLCWRAGWRT
jgi:membrane protease YdiL (CAAX protease family)